MHQNKLRALWEKDEQASFKGWDFSYLKRRWESEPLPWDYRTIVQRHLNADYKLLDMGTGGGEFILSLGHPYTQTSVTEMWEPNVKLCKERLAPMGIDVHQVYEDDALPFAYNEFDIIINRHESYDVDEVRRILKPNGIFITQQVGGQNNMGLSQRLIKDFVPLYAHWDLSYATKELANHGFDVVYEVESFPYLRFYDVGALVYYAKVIEWEFPDFSVKRCFDTLYAMHQELKDEPYIESREHRFIVVSKVNK